MDNDSQEIEIRELLSIIKQYKKLIISFMLLSLFLGGLYSYLNPRYESSALVAIGHIKLSPSVYDERNLSATVYLEDPNGVVRRLTDGTVQAVPDKKAPNYIAVKAQAKTPAAAQEIVSQATNALLRQHDDLFAAVMNRRNREREEIVKQMNSNDAAIAAMDKLSTEKQQDIATAALMVIEKSQLSRMQLDLRQQVIADAERSSPPYVNKTSLISPPSLPEKQKISPIVICSIALLFGLLVSFLLVFLRTPSFLKSIHKEQ